MEGDNHMFLKCPSAVQRSLNVKTALVGFLAFFIVLILAPLVVSAAGDVPTIDSTLQGTGIPMVNLTVFLVNILRIFFGFLGVIAVFLLIYGGFVWMTASGETAKVEKAKQIIYNTIIGLIVIFSAFAISSFIMAWLTGLGGGGTSGGTTNIPGGNGDWSRSAIGAGPIQSVYPAPNAVNIPINTRIAVTFKENIKPESICNVSANGFCEGGIMKNVTICEISATGTDCLAGSVFNLAAYASSTVFQTSANDKKTFVFYPKTYLGLDDNLNRTFKVVLNEGIIAEATGKSVFDSMIRVKYYNWAFKTNGILDFDPPVIANYELYPNPDNQADVYAIGSQSSSGQAVIQLSASPRFDTPALLNDTPYVGTALSGVAITKVSGSTAIPSDYLKLETSGFDVKALTKQTLNFTVQSGTGRYVTFNSSPDLTAILGVKYATPDECDGNARCLLVSGGNTVNITGSGIVIKANGNFSGAAGSTWSFAVSPAVNGDVLTFVNGTTETNFIFASSTWGAEISRASTTNGQPTTIKYTTIKSSNNILASTTLSLANTLNSKLNTAITAVVDPANTNKINLTPVSAGANNLRLFSQSSVLTISGGLSGSDRQTDRTALPIGSKLDPYNNSVFRVTFNKAINPINVDSYIKVKIGGVDMIASTTITNQYKTIELMGTKPCGVNSCGKMMYCWVDPNLNPNSSIPATTTIVAADLMACTNGTQEAGVNSWCKTFGGTCDSAIDGGRCKLATGLYYPQAKANINGIVDMSNNSFNGNFNTAVKANGSIIGNAEGPVSFFNANNPSHFNGLKFSYKNDNDTNGDNFSWSFFLSTQIDRAAPLISQIIPYGGSSFGAGVNETFRDPVRLVFNGLMRMATLKPGWGYGINRTDPAWNTRYLLLKTITAGANPVGYWVNSLNLDAGTMINNKIEGANDGLADYTVADVEHNAYDQAVNYGPMGANGLESITQNCLLPGSGPIDAGPGTCKYNSDGTTSGCVTDSNISPNKRVTSTNPSSFSSMLCSDIDGAKICNGVCKTHYATSGTPVNEGSWVISKDKSTITDATSGKTGCCYGNCF